MYSFPNLEPVCCSMSGSNSYFLTCIQISQEAGKVVWYSHLLKNFPQFVVIYTVKGFGVNNKAEVDVFLEFSRFFNDPMDVGNSLAPWICSFWSGWMTSPSLNHSCRLGFVSFVMWTCHLLALMSSSFLLYFLSLWEYILRNSPMKGCVESPCLSDHVFPLRCLFCFLISHLINTLAG